MHKDSIITVLYGILSVVLCVGIVCLLNYTNVSTAVTAQASTATDDISQLSPVQQALYEHMQGLENPAYRRVLIFRKIEKLLEEGYEEQSLTFADEEFIPEAGRAYEPKDIVATDSALILQKYANIKEGTDSRRLVLLNTGACLIDAVPYFWGGKTYQKGWNSRWGQDVVVSGGSFIAQVAEEGSQPIRYANAEGTEILLPYGLDCSGFVSWTYYTALGYKIGYNTREQFANSNEISEDELLPGDLGFLCSPSSPAVNHVGMYIGENDRGQKMWLHCSSSSGVTVGSPDFLYYRRPNIDIYYESTEEETKN